MDHLAYLYVQNREAVIISDTNFFFPLMYSDFFLRKLH